MEFLREYGFPWYLAGLATAAVLIAALFRYGHHSMVMTINLQVHQIIQAKNTDKKLALEDG